MTAILEGVVRADPPPTRRRRRPNRDRGLILLAVPSLVWYVAFTIGPLLINLNVLTLVGIFLVALIARSWI